MAKKAWPTYRPLRTLASPYCTWGCPQALSKISASKMGTISGSRCSSSWTGCPCARCTWPSTSCPTWTWSTRTWPARCRSPGRPASTGQRTWTPGKFIWQYGLWSFQTGDAKLEIFLPMNQHTQRKLLNFEFWINGELSKSDKIWLSKSIFYVENHPNLSQFCFHWRIPIQEHIFCYWHFLIKSILK